jgi:hypothetical protein
MVLFELLDRSLESMYIACVFIVLDLVCMCYCLVVFVVSPSELSSFVCIVKHCILGEWWSGVNG